jgi:hypothetical protein
MATSGTIRSDGIARRRSSRDRQAGRDAHGPRADRPSGSERCRRAVLQSPTTNRASEIRSPSTSQGTASIMARRSPGCAGHMRRAGKTEPRVGYSAKRSRIKPRAYGRGLNATTSRPESSPECHVEVMKKSQPAASTIAMRVGTTSPPSAPGQRCPRGSPMPRPAALRTWQTLDFSTASRGIPVAPDVRGVCSNTRARRVR